MELQGGAAFGLVLLVVLAGCSGLTGTETDTFTPAPVPDPTATPTPVPELAPGVTSDGITDPLALTTAHSPLLRRNTYTANTERVVHDVNGTLRLRRAATVRVGEQGRSRRFVEHEGPAVTYEPARLDIWRNKTLYLVALTDDGETAYDGRVASGSGARLYSVYETIPGTQQMFSLLQSLETRTVSRTADGSYRVRATGIDQQDKFDRAVLETETRNVSFVATITPDGRIESYELRYETDRDNRAVRVVRRLRTRNVGSTTIERPPWFAEALNATET
jgi:hypothetical protein